MSTPPPPPKRLSAEERKKQIVATTFTLVSQRGFKSVSVRDVAHAAGINEALIYRYFPAKADLLRAVLTQIVSRQPVASASLPAGPDEFRAALDAFIAFFLDTALADPSKVKTIMYAVMEDYPLPDEFNLSKEGTFLNWLYRSIQKGQAEWGFDPLADPLAAASSFMGGLIFAIMQSAVIRSIPPIDPAPFRRAFLHSFLAQLCDWPKVA